MSQHQGPLDTAPGGPCGCGLCKFKVGFGAQHPGLSDQNYERIYNKVINSNMRGEEYLAVVELPDGRSAVIWQGPQGTSVDIKPNAQVQEFLSRLGKTV